MAERYWVGGTGNWSDATNHWATTSGGAPGAGNVPTTADNVHFNAASNTVAYTVTVDATANCLDLLFDAAPSVSGTITLTGSSILNCYRSSLNLTGMVYTYTGTLTYKSTASGCTITSNAVSMSASITFDGIGGVWTLQDALTTTLNITLLRGHLDTNSMNVSCRLFVSTTNNSGRALTLGTSTFTINNSNNSTGWHITTSGGNFTLTANTSTIISGGTNALFDGGGLTYYDLNHTTSAGSFTIGGANTFRNVTKAVGASNNSSFCFAASQVITGTLTHTTTGQSRGFIYSGDTGASLNLENTITITAAAVSVDKVDFLNIVGAGASSWTGSSYGDLGGILGITFPAARPMYLVLGGGGGTKAWTGTTTWSLSSGGSTISTDYVPRGHDTVIGDINSVSSGGVTLTTTNARFGKGGINLNGINNALILDTGTTKNTYGDLQLVSLVTVSGGLTFRGVTNQTFTPNNAILNSNIAIQAKIGVSVSLGESLSTTGSITQLSGIFVDNGYNVTATNWISSGSLTRNLNRSGIWTLTGSGTVFNSTGSNYSYTDSITALTKLTDSTNIIKTFAGQNITYNNIELAGTGSGSFDFTGSPIFNNFKVSNVPKNIRFTAGTTTTFSSFTPPVYNPADTKFVRLSGSAIDYFSSIDKSVTGSNTITLDLSLQTYTPAADVTLVDKSSGNNGLKIILLTTGIIRLVIGDGASLTNIDSTIGVGFTDSTRHTIGIIWTDNTGASFTKDGTALGTAVSAVKVLTNASMPISIGGSTTIGDLYRIQVGTVYDFNPNNWVVGNTWTATVTGEVWTRNGSALIHPEIKISSITSAQHTLVSSGTISGRYLNISYSNAV